MVAHPVALGLDAQLGEDVEELADEVLGHVRRLGSWRRGDVAEGLAEVHLEVGVLAGGDLVERVVVVDPEQVAHRHPAALERPEDGVVEEHAPQGPHVDAPGGRLGVVDDVRLGAVDGGGEIGEPEHGRAP